MLKNSQAAVMAYLSNGVLLFWQMRNCICPKIGQMILCDAIRLAYMHAQRYFVEQCFKESKQVLGLSQFQTRKWIA